MSSRPAKARDIKRRFLPKFYELAMERKRKHEEYMANQQVVQLIVEAFDGKFCRERVYFGIVINDGPWGHLEVSGR